MKKPDKHNIEIRPGEIVIFWPGSATASFLTPETAVEWATILIAAAQGAFLLEKREENDLIMGSIHE